MTDTRLHITYGPPQVYLGQVCMVGGRRWRTVTGPCRTPEAALARAVQKMERGDKRARALSVARRDVVDYYGPMVAMEATR